jgi:hypothetical protein
MESINDRELPEELMAAMLRLEEEAYRAGQHGCCEEGGTKYENPSCWKACETHGPRARASLSLLCHALAQWAEQIVSEAAEVAAGNDDAMEIGKGIAERIRALAPPCPRCRGWGYIPNAGHCDCSRGKAFAHWARLNLATPTPTTGGER